jgi:FKBP-type peptidyl-prolyl cis-trans isomerase
MRKALNYIVTAAMLLAAVSCKDSSIYSGYERTESGAYMKFIERHKEGEMPRIGDEVTIEMAQYFDDTLLFTTAGEKPMKLQIESSEFVGDVPDAIRMMHIGDSAQLVVMSDSVFIVMMQMEVPEEYKGKPIYYDLKLLDIKPSEIIEAERRAMLDSLRIVENDYLVGLQADPKNTVTESGLIIMEKKGKGQVAKLGDYLNMDFVMCTMDGDTLMNTIDIEPLEVQYGEEFICKGFAEALGMLPQGGTMHFVIPSELAFDSTGYHGMIGPYAPLVIDLKMNEILDQAGYDAKQARIKAEEEAEKERLSLLESGLIEQYIKDNAITVKPTETGIYIIPVEDGMGDLAQWGDTVSVHYTLNNLKGELVESSYDYGEPMTFVIGQGGMIPSIEDAVMTMAPGAKVKVVTPSSQAFGEIAVDEELLPAYSPMMIELELVSVK